jgi:hypothetical protein
MVRSRKLCTNHYDKLVRWGDPLQIINPKESTQKQSKPHNTHKIKKVFQDILKQTMKNTTRPNKKEMVIGQILDEIGITCKFLQHVDYKTLENKIASKQMDILWKNSTGNKKIIEYNGRYHFDCREHKFDEIHQVHGKSIILQDLWDEENMILNQIRKAGYEILVVWQLDFLNDYENEVKRIKEFASS